MFRHPIALQSARRIAATVAALHSAGDFATAETLRKWFNRSFTDYAIDRQVSEGRIIGFMLKSGQYSEPLKLIPTRQPGARRQSRPEQPEPEPENDDLPDVLRQAFGA